MGDTVPLWGDVFLGQNPFGEHDLLNGNQELRAAIWLVAETAQGGHHAGLTGQYGLYDVCLSLPCIVGVNGVAQTLPIHLSDEEMTQLHASADAIRSAIQLMND